MIKWLTPHFYKIATKIGKWMIVIVSLSLALHHWGVVNLEKIPIPSLVNILYIYLVINAAAASPFIYIEKKPRMGQQKLCPKCAEPLEEIVEYKCSNCGKLRFNENNLRETE